MLYGMLIIFLFFSFTISNLACVYLQNIRLEKKVSETAATTSTATNIIISDKYCISVYSKTIKSITSLEIKLHKYFFVALDNTPTGISNALIGSILIRQRSTYLILSITPYLLLRRAELTCLLFDGFNVCLVKIFFI